eukprot:s748_g26.t1
MWHWLAGLVWLSPKVQPGLCDGSWAHTSEKCVSASIPDSASGHGSGGTGHPLAVAFIGSSKSIRQQVLRESSKGKCPEDEQYRGCDGYGPSSMDLRT